MYPFYLHDFTTRTAISSPLVVDLTCNYDSIANTGLVTATVTNTSSNTVSGNIHFVIIENDIPYNWYDLTTVEHVCRDMVPNANGEAVSIPTSDTIIRSRNFSINPAWEEHNCNIVVFVQGATREIYQGAEVAIVDDINMDYYGLTFTELSGNNNQIAQPGEQIRMFLTGKNNGDGTYTGGATINSSDPYITILASNPQSVSIGPGDVDIVINIDVDIAPSCPSPHEWDFQINFGTGDVDDVKFIITNQPGFADDMESGQGGWILAGSNNNWHITNYKSHSPTSSWYCGIEGSYQYTDRNVASLISPYFVVTPDSSIKFWHQYRLETGWDYGHFEIDNNIGWWQILDEYNGMQSSWNQVSYSLSAYSGQTVRIRYRFLSDQSVTDEGWYIDDVEMPIIIGVEEQISTLEALTPTLQIYPNPFSKKMDIRYQVVNFDEVSLNIYDVSGRLVKQFGHSAIRLSEQITWYGTDEHGLNLPAGVYFIRLEGDDFTREEKVILLR